MTSRSILILLCVFCLILALLCIWTGISLWQDGHASVNWPSTNGKIVISKVDVTNKRNRKGGGSKTSYYVEVEYEYVVKRVTYRGSRISFGASPGGWGDEGQAEADKMLSTRYRIMKNVRVSYDPDDPSNSVLKPGPGIEHGPSLTLGLLLLLAAMGLAYLCLQGEEK